MKAKESKTKKSPPDSSSATSSRKNFSGTIRAPREKDHARLADLAGQLSYPSTAQEISHRLAAMANSNEHAAFVAEMPDGEIAGWIAVFILRGLEVIPAEKSAASSSTNDSARKRAVNTCSPMPNSGYVTAAAM